MARHRLSTERNSCVKEGADGPKDRDFLLPGTVDSGVGREMAFELDDRAWWLQILNFL